MELGQKMQRGKLVNGLNVMVNTEDVPYSSSFAEMTDQRQDHCWLCDRTPLAWVREVVFDLGDKEPQPVRKTALVVDSTDYPGAVPGFCPFHVGAGPGQLAELIYNSHEVVAWGYRPSRWFVVFTDGTMTGGAALQVDHSPQRAPITHDTHTKGDSHHG